MEKQLKVGMYGGKFIPIHQGHIYCINKALSEVDKLYLVLCYDELRDMKLCLDSKCKQIPIELRYRWVCQIAKQFDNVVPILAKDGSWDESTKEILKQIPEQLTHVYFSDKEYVDIFKQQYGNNINCCVVDESRSKFNISATKIRNDPFGNWDMIPNIVKPFFVKKVLIVGQESVGKSTLIKKLALHYNTNYVEEYGRTLCEEYGGFENVLCSNDYVNIVYNHKVNEIEKTKTANKILLVDTDPIITNYYHELMYNYPNGTIKTIEKDSICDYDLVLYIYDDNTTYVDDGYRLGYDEEQRKNNEKLLLDSYYEYKDDVVFKVLFGDYKTKFVKAIEEIDKLL